MTEILTVDGGQKDVLLRRANIQENIVFQNKAVFRKNYRKIEKQESACNMFLPHVSTPCLNFTYLICCPNDDIIVTRHFQLVTFEIYYCIMQFLLHFLPSPFIFHFLYVLLAEFTGYCCILSK